MARLTRIHTPTCTRRNSPRSAEWGTLQYKLTVDGKLVPVDGGAAAAGAGGSPAPAGGSRAAASPAAAASPSPAAALDCRWTVHTGAGRTCLVEYTFATMDLLVNDIKAAVEGEFVEEEEEGEAEAGGASRPAAVSGVRYKLLLGPSLLEAQLTVIPSDTGRGPPTCALVSNGVIIQPMRK